ncbi:MAG TPA: hypothetical protein ENH82_07355, partial [bacterium]|nr:hypothetical protein [bacterium]
EQGGVCAICRKPERNCRPLAVDHSHVTGQVRSLLCVNCNTELGIIENSHKRHFIKKLYMYLEHWEANNE